MLTNTYKYLNHNRVVIEGQRGEKNVLTSLSKTLPVLFRKSICLTGSNNTQ